MLFEKRYQDIVFKKKYESAKKYPEGVIFNGVYAFTNGKEMIPFDHEDVVLALDTPTELEKQTLVNNSSEQSGGSNSYNKIWDQESGHYIKGFSNRGLAEYSDEARNKLGKQLNLEERIN